YRVLAKATKAARGNRREMISRTLDAVKRKLAEGGIRAEVFGREKHVYSTYRKMIEKHLSFSEVHDIFGVRVVVADVPACYLAMGALHGLYKPIPGKFKDYIAIPKANGYQSIHTDLIGPYGVPVEVQVRTDQMHRLAESGVASHWLYKDETGKARSNIRHFLKTMQYEESASLGERLLDQALRALKGVIAEIDDASWERVVREGGARSKEELLADIGLGKRLPAVVARRLMKG